MYYSAFAVKLSESIVLGCRFIEGIAFYKNPLKPECFPCSTFCFFDLYGLTIEVCLIFVKLRRIKW